MATLLQSIETLIDNITVTDRQEENIKQSLSNIEGYLKDKENNLSVERTFTTGSYERDTIIRPLNDIDMFAVLKFDDWKDQYGNFPGPQSVLTKIKNYLNSLNDYKDKVKQDRPCVTIELSDKNFDILPSFKLVDGEYRIPNFDLTTWTYSYPEQLTIDLDNTHKQCKNKLKPTIKAIKYWNRENGKIIPSYHVEETAINIFKITSFTNYEESIRLWFNNAEYHLNSQKFDSSNDYNAVIKKIKRDKEKLNDAKKKYDERKEGEAMKIWKDVFGKEFPTVDVEEAQNFSKSLSEGTLKYSIASGLSTSLGNAVGASKGFFNGLFQK
ncbi:MAG: nucleotidyltransferase [Bacteroidales bacterium]|nr:nucleotidyltransferase [Bacteroidales bacterium]